MQPHLSWKGELHEGCSGRITLLSPGQEKYDHGYQITRDPIQPSGPAIETCPVAQVELERSNHVFPGRDGLQEILDGSLDEPFEPFTSHGKAMLQFLAALSRSWLRRFSEQPVLRQGPRGAFNGFEPDAGTFGDIQEGMLPV